VEELCDKLDVQVADPLQFDSSVTAFLGMGAMGRVIAVVPKGNPQNSGLFALKVCQNDQIRNLECEFWSMIDHVGCLCQCIAHPVDNSMVVTSSKLFPTLGGFLMNSVGKTIQKETILKNKLLFTEAIMSLFHLHTHNPSIIHGDARLSNLLINNETEKVFWVDLTSYKRAMICEHAKKCDMETFIKSVSENLLTPAVNEAIASYSMNTSTVNVLINLIHNLNNWN
jgi:hypothetical protein